MTKILTYILLSFLLSLVKMDTVSGQAIKWQKCLGGTLEDKALDVLINPDGTFIMVGYSNSNDGDVTGNHGGGDAWVVKLDTAGNIIWQRALGGTGNEYFNTVIATNDTAYLCIGYSNSNNGDVSGNHGSGDIWVVKISRTGIVMWSKCYGGSKVENTADGLLADDGGFTIIGTSSSYDGDVFSGVNGRPDSDGWALKINSSGNIDWEKCINTNFSFLKPSHIPNDIGYNIIRAEDGNYYALVAGSEDYQAGLWPYYDTLIRTPGKLYKLDKNTGAASLIGSMGGDYNFAMCKTPAGIYSSFVEKSYFYPEYCFDETLYTSFKADGSSVFTKHMEEPTAQCTFSALKTRLAGSHGIAPLSTISSFIAAGEKEKTGQFGIATSAYIDMAGTKTTYGGNIGGWGTFTSEAFSSIKVFPDGQDYIVVGNTNSTDGDVSGYHGGNGGGPSDCWVVRLVSLNRVAGNVFVDLNNNNIKDPGEPPFLHAVARTSKPGFDQWGIPVNGFYSNSVGLGSFTTTLAISSPYYTVTPASKTSVFSTYKNVDSANFALHPIPGIIDYAVSVIPLLAARPGFPLKYKITYTNKGTTTLTNKEVKFIKDARSQFINAAPAFTNMTGDTIKWNITSLDPEGTGSIILDLVLDSPPLINFNDTIESGAFIDNNLDIFPADNAVSIRQLVTGSYDPNDKQEVHAGFIMPQEITAGKFLDYTIRFQNTGNDTAFNIIIRDTLDNKLEWDSISFISSSHPCQFNISNSRYLTLTFNNIKLLDSTNNEPLSHGYISYRIKPKSSLVLGDTILNNASIYFDFNPPVKTNTQLTIVRTRPVPVNWTGSASTAWENPLNWSNGMVPDANTNVTINNGMTNYPVVNSNAVCRSLDVKPGSNITVKTGYTITVVH